MTKSLIEKEIEESLSQEYALDYKERKKRKLAEFRDKNSIIQFTLQKAREELKKGIKHTYGCEYQIQNSGICRCDYRERISLIEKVMGK